MEPLLARRGRGRSKKNPLGKEGTGEVEKETFCQFSSMTYGLRAALKLLRTYYQKHGCVTLRQIIRRWAPETENKTEAYIQTVSRMTGWHPDAPLPPMKQETQVVWHDIVLAMATVECGLDQVGRDSLTPYLEDAWSLL